MLENNGDCTRRNAGPRSDAGYVVGYGKPPKNTQFKPGRSGNPKGRPKGARNLRTALLDVLAKPVNLTIGNKIYRVSRIEALYLKQWERGIRGSERATQSVLTTAKEIGALADQPVGEISSRDYLSDETISALSPEALDELIKIEQDRLNRRLNVSAENPSPS